MYCNHKLSPHTSQGLSRGEKMKYMRFVFLILTFIRDLLEQLLNLRDFQVLTRCRGSKGSIEWAVKYHRVMNGVDTTMKTKFTSVP